MIGDGEEVDFKFKGAVFVDVGEDGLVDGALILAAQGKSEVGLVDERPSIRFPEAFGANTWDIAAVRNF